MTDYRLYFPPNRKSETKAKTNQATWKKEVLAHKEALAKLEGVPDKLDRLMAMMTEKTDSLETETEQIIPSSVTDPISSLISKATATHSDNSQDEASPSSTLLQALNVMQPEPVYGDPINDDVAKSIAGLYSCELSKNVRETLKEKWKVPENCKALAVPKVNPEIWAMLPPTSRQIDFGLQQQQQLVSMATVRLS